MPLFFISKGINHPDTHADRYNKKRHSQRLRWKRKGNLDGKWVAKGNKGRKVETEESVEGKVTIEMIQL